MRETKAEKANRLLTEGRLWVYDVRQYNVAARCEGDTETYDLGYAEGHWRCSCAAHTDCSHLHALWRVTVNWPKTREVR